MFVPHLSSIKVLVSLDIMSVRMGSPGRHLKTIIIFANLMLMMSIIYNDMEHREMKVLRDSEKVVDLMCLSSVGRKFHSSETVAKAQSPFDKL